VLGEAWDTNPREIVTPDWLEVIRLLRLCRGGMGYALLPDAGGVNDQPAWLLDAFAHLGALEAEADRQAAEPGRPS
jgi:hypothetical protein